jgi:hypothetical protein
MSIEAINRSQIREARIWSQFYEAAFVQAQVDERTIIFGLYASSYKNTANYLSDIEAFELDNLLNDYNIKIDGLTTDEQVLINQIVVKRYLADVEAAIHADKMISFQNKIDSESAEMDAKIAALAADRAALLTLQSRLAAEIKTIAARIQVLQAEIALEAVNLALADMAVHEKEIQLAETNLRILRVANEVLRIQLQIVEAGIDLLEVDMRKEETKIRTEQTKIDTIRAGFTEKELEIAQKHVLIAGQEVILATKETEITGKKLVQANAESSYLMGKQTAEAINKANKLDLLAARRDASIDAADNHLEATKVSNENRISMADAERTGVDADIEVRDITAVTQELVNDTHGEASTLAYQAAIYSATKLAKVNVISTLTHTVGAVSSP